MMKRLSVLFVLLLALLAGQAYAAVAIVNSCDPNNVAPHSAGITASCTVGASAGATATVVAASGIGASMAFGTMTIGGTTVSASYTISSGNLATAFYCKLSPGTGSVAVSLGTGTGGSVVTIMAMTVSGSDTSTCFTNGATGTYGAAPSINLTSVGSGDLVVDIYATGGAVSAAATAGQTILYNDDSLGFSYSAGSSTKGSVSGTVTMSWTTGGGGTEAVAAIKVAPAAGTTNAIRVTQE